jgi:hypothetical protein
VENKFEGNTPHNLIDVVNASKLKIHKNEQKDTCFSFVNIEGSDYVFVEKQKASTVQHFVKVNNSERIFVIANEISRANNISFEITKSEKITIRKNTLSKVIDTIIKPINIHRDDNDNKSNANKPDPIILGYNLKKSMEGDCKKDSTRLGIFLYGKAAPKDSVEVYFTDSLMYTLNKLVITGKADKNGNWDIRIPRDQYIKEAKKWYHFVVTATDTLGNTSQISNKLNFGRVVNKIIVKYTANDGSLTLRDAIEKVNCSDVRSLVKFEIDDQSKHLINLTDTLPKINAYLGFEMDASTQRKYADSMKYTFANQKVIINTSAFKLNDKIAKAPVFTLLAETDSSIIKSFDFEECKSIALIQNKQNTLDSLRATYTRSVNNLGDTAFVFGGGAKNLLKHATISGYHLGVYLPNNASENKFISDTIANTTVAYLFRGETKSNLVDQNWIKTDSIAMIFDHASQLNLVKYSHFGTPSAPITFPAFYLSHASNQALINNYMPVAQMTDPKADKAFIVLKGKANTNLISANKLGVDHNHDYFTKSNVRGIWVKPSTMDSIPQNNTLVSNEIVGLTLPAIQLDTVSVTNINDNYIGVDSLFKAKGAGTQDYKLVPGIDVESILITKSNIVTVNNNTLVNYGTYGIDVRSSTDVILEKNKIFSENTINKGINLNNKDALLVSNKNKFAPFDTIAAPLITDDEIEGVSKLTLTGTSVYSNASVHIYEAFDNAALTPDEDLSQALRYVKSVKTNTDGTWSADLTTDNFGFTKYNKYVAQLTYDNQSSELSPNYRLDPLLCKLVEKKVDLIADTYNPCPKSQFKVDATLEGLKYEWTSDKFSTITTQVAQIDTSANVKLTITDGFSDCKLEETFEVIYKNKPIYPEFIVSSEIYVADTITLVDVSETRPESYDWSSTDKVNIISVTSATNIVGPDGKTYPNGREVKFTVPDTGVYIITQRSKRDGCFISVDKEIEAKYKDPNAKNPYALVPTIEGLVVFPVPVPKGKNANAFIKTTTKDPVYLTVINDMGLEVFTYVIEGSLTYNIALPTDNLIDGIYILRMETETDAISYKFYINKD